MTLTPTLLLLRALTVLAGGVFITYALTAYRKHRSPAMLILGTAIALMVLGAAIEIVAYLFVGASLAMAEVLEASVTLLAFLILLLSVRSQRH